MSNSPNVYERLFKLQAMVGKLVLDGKRNPTVVADVLQKIVDSASNISIDTTPERILNIKTVDIGLPKKTGYVLSFVLDIKTVRDLIELTEQQLVSHAFLDTPRRRRRSGGKTPKEMIEEIKAALGTLGLSLKAA